MLNYGLMSHEDTQTHQPEYFKDARTIEQLLATYDEYAGSISATHEDGYASVAAHYEGVIKMEAQSPGTMDVENELINTQVAVELAGAASPLQVEELVSAVAEAIPSMLNANDFNVLQNVRKQVDQYGISSGFVLAALGDGSSAAVRKAMRASLDADVLQNVHAQASRHGASSDYVLSALRDSSSATVREVFSNMISPNWSSPRSESNSKTTEEAEFIKGAFRNGAFKKSAKPQGDQPSQDPRESHQTTTETPKEAPRAKPERDTGVEDIIRKVSARSSRYGWIQNVPLKDIEKVINTVLKLRANREAQGGTLSDGSAYRRYRKEADTDPSLTPSVQILEALMDGDLNGKLPF